MVEQQMYDRLIQGVVKNVKWADDRKEKACSVNFFHNEEFVSADKEKNDEAFKKAAYSKGIQ